MTNQEKISAAWRADDDCEAEMLEMQRLSDIARANGPDPEDDEYELTMTQMIRNLWKRWME